MCGIGNWGKNHARHFHDLGALKGLCDSNRETLKSLAEVYHEVRITPDFSEILADSSIDAVVLAVPTFDHHAFAKSALLSGKHVFVEKPMAIRASEAEELCVIARRKKLKLMVGHLLLYHPAILKMKEIIRSRELGEIYYLYTQRLNLGQVRRDENAMWSLAPHDISVLLELFGSRPANVSATGHSYIQRTRGIEDVIFMNFRFRDGRSAHIHLSWLDPHKIRRITLVGSKKMVVFDDMEQSDKLKVYDKGVDHAKSRTLSALIQAMVLRVGNVHAPFLENIEPLKLECMHFIDCIEKDRKPRSDGENGLEVVRILEAATASLRKGGKSVTL